MGWAAQERATADLGDRRLNRRLINVAQQLADKPTASMAGESVVLCLQDTTELDFNGQRIDGLGPLSYEAQRGMYLHPTYAVSAQPEPLGLLDA